MASVFTERDYLEKFPKGCKLIIEVVYPAEYRIGFEYEGLFYRPGSGSYYNFATAIKKCWEAFEQTLSKKNEIASNQDIAFLREMQERLEKAPRDSTQYEYVNQMIQDWIDQLEQ